MVKYLNGPISEEEFYLREKCYGRIKAEYAKKWREAHGYKHASDIPIRGIVERDKYLDEIMGTEEAKNKVNEMVLQYQEHLRQMQPVIYKEQE